LYAEARSTDEKGASSPKARTKSMDFHSINGMRRQSSRRGSIAFGSAYDGPGGLHNLKRCSTTGTLGIRRCSNASTAPSLASNTPSPRSSCISVCGRGSVLFNLRVQATTAKVTRLRGCSTTTVVTAARADKDPTGLGAAQVGLKTSHTRATARNHDTVLSTVLSRRPRDVCMYEFVNPEGALRAPGVTEKLQQR